MIAKSVTVDVPWGHVCGYPTAKGDLYGGAMYVASAAQTPQGRAIQEASIRFGDGRTLPFTPCKKGYMPLLNDENRKMYACPIHNIQREKRVKQEGGCFRKGEFDLNHFWSREIEREDAIPAKADVCE
jgi:hypothetical protein